LTLRHRVAIATATNYCGKVVTVGATFLVTPVILHSIGPAPYGLWMMINSIAGYGVLLDCGMANTLIKYVAEYQARRELVAAGPLVATSLTLYTAFCLLGLVISSIAAFLLRHWQPVHGIDAPVVVFLIGCNIALALPGAVPSAVLRGLQRFELVNAINVFTTIAGVIATVTVLKAGCGLVGMLYLNLIMLAVGQVLSVAAVRKIAPELPFKLVIPAKRDTHKIFSFSISVLAVQISGRLQTKTDEIVIGMMASLAATAPYTVARRLSVLPQILVDQFLQVILPVASEIHATKDHEKLCRLFVTSSRIAIAAVMPVGLLLAASSSIILTQWVGREYEKASAVAVILVASAMINTSVWPAASILQAMARHRVLAIAALANGIANLILSIVFLRWYGLVGVATATLLPTVAECLLFVWPYALGVLGISWARIGREVILPVAIPLLCWIVSPIVLVRLFSPASIFVPGIILSLASALYVVFFLLQPAVQVERDIVRRLFERLTSRKRETILANVA